MNCCKNKMENVQFVERLEIQKIHSHALIIVIIPALFVDYYANIVMQVLG